MAGVKFVNDELFCSVCEKKVNDKQNYCTNCGNPLKLQAAADDLKEKVSYIDNFLRQVYELAKTEKISIERAMKKVRTSYE